MEQQSTANEIADLKVAVREAHEALKDLRHVIKEAREVIKAVEAAANEEVADRVMPIIEGTLGGLGVAIDEAIVESEKRIYARFDKVADLLLGEDQATKRRGEPSLMDMARAAKLLDGG